MAKYGFLGGTDMAYVWVNPSLETEPSTTDGSGVVMEGKSFSNSVVTNIYQDFDVELNERLFYWIKAGNENGWSDFTEFAEGYVLPEPTPAILLLMISGLMTCRDK